MDKCSGQAADCGCSRCSKTRQWEALRRRNDAKYLCKDCGLHHYPGSSYCRARKPSVPSPSHPSRSLSAQEKEEIHKSVNCILKVMSDVFKIEPSADPASLPQSSGTCDETPQAEGLSVDHENAKKSQADALCDDHKDTGDKVPEKCSKHE